MDETNDYQNLDRMVVGARQTGKPLVRLGFTLQLYLRDGHLRETRARVAAMLADFTRTARGNITHWQKDGASRLSPLAGRDVAALLAEEVARNDPKVDLWAPHVTDAQDPPRFQGMALMQYDNPRGRRVSRLELGIPATIVRNDPDALIRHILDWCAQLGPLHGSAGLGPIAGAGMVNRYPDEVWPLLARFSGLDFPAPYLVGDGAHIRGVNWLTVLGDPILAAIGGAEALAGRINAAWGRLDPASRGATGLPPGFEVRPFAGGALVRAGEHPQLGDVNIGGVPLTYRIVNAALRDLRFMDYPNRSNLLIRVPGPLDAHEETMRWLTRFDGEG